MMHKSDMWTVFACAALNGILAADVREESNFSHIQDAAARAGKIADLMLQQFKERQGRLLP